VASVAFGTTEHNRALRNTQKSRKHMAMRATMTSGMPLIGSPHDDPNDVTPNCTCGKD
jgi:hypothetical protein